MTPIDFALGALMRPTLVWPDRREIPCRDLDLDCFALDGIIPFDNYKRCQAYAPELGRCIFLADDDSDARD